MIVDDNEDENNDAADDEFVDYISVVLFRCRILLKGSNFPDG